MYAPARLHTFGIYIAGESEAHSLAAGAGLLLSRRGEKLPCKGNHIQLGEGSCSLAIGLRLYIIRGRMGVEEDKRQALKGRRTRLSCLPDFAGLPPLRHAHKTRNARTRHSLDYKSAKKYAPQGTIQAT